MSPVSAHQSQSSQRISGSSTLPRVPQASPPIGAVASLAVSGGISQEELFRLGHNRPPPISVRSTRAAVITTRGGGVRGGLRRGHHTAPPGTVHIGKSTRTTRCDICLSPPSSTFCSFNPSPRSSPLHLTRVGGISTEGNDRKSSLPVLPTDQLVRVGPGNVVSTRGQSYAKINWYPQPYKSTSFENTSGSASPPNAAVNTAGEFAISSRASMHSDTADNVESSGQVPISPSGHSASSVDVPTKNENQGSCPVSSTSEEAVHFFGSSFATAPSTTTATGAVDKTAAPVPPHSPVRGDSAYQLRLYHQHIARSVRNLRRYRHIYGDSFTLELASTNQIRTENPTGSISTIQHRRSSADEALIVRGEGNKEALLSPPSPPPSGSTKQTIFSVEQPRQRRHLFVSHRTAQSETQRRIEETIPVATVIVALENNENTMTLSRLEFYY
ncbi:hypothetical protein Aperf_G00000059921 [Anoplocephala perfoliata]